MVTTATATSGRETCVKPTNSVNRSHKQALTAYKTLFFTPVTCVLREGY